MSTQRQDDNNIIGSGSVPGTVRGDNSVIGSGGNANMILSSNLSDDIILNGKQYQIISQIARSGEAEVFLVKTENLNLVFKYYYSQYKPKDEILNKLKGLRHDDIIALIEYGYHQDRFFEISEYAEGGTLADIMPVSSLSKTQEIVHETNEALNYCHSNGIIHRDIKPDNIFYRTKDKKDIAIGDFGIASNITTGGELVRTTLARTNLYAAPELFTSIQGKTTIEKSVDYYALGMTLLHLWVGKDPFEDNDEFGIMRLKSEGRVLFPDGLDPDVEKLIKGLITVIPHDRWGYDEVSSWLKGEDVKVHYKTIEFEYKPYSFGLIDGEQVVVNNPKDLASLLEKYPEKGEGHLYRNTIAKWLEQVDQGLFNDLMDIVEKDFPKDRTAGLTKAIYILDQDRPFKGADNKTKLRSQEEIADYFEQNSGHYQNDLKNPNAAFYIFLDSRNYKTKADEYRAFFKNYDPELALNTLIYTLQGSDKYIIGKYTFYQPEELIKVDDNTKAKIIQDLANTNSKLSLWITIFKNLQPSINKWRVLKRYDATTLRYAIQEGFSLNELNAVNETEFYTIFKENCDLLFSSYNSSSLQTESNYWLTNYQNTSLTQVAINYLKTENYDNKIFLSVINYALTNHKDARLNIYEVTESLLNTIQFKTKNDLELLQRVLEIAEVNIEKSWSDDQAATHRFIDCLKKYLDFAETNLSKHSEILSQLTYQLDDRISNGVRNDINICKGDEKMFNKYYNDIKTCINRLEKINPDQPYCKRHQKEFELIRYQQNQIAAKLSDEKQGKVNITYATYNDILVKRRDGKKQSSKNAFLKKFIISLAIAIIAFALLLATINNGENSIKIVTGALALLGLGLGILLGLVSENLVTGIVACIVLTWLGSRYGTLIPVKAIYILSCLTVAFFGGRAILVNYKREKSISDITLYDLEKDGLKQSLKAVDNHFNKKKLFENYDETLRLLLLDDQDFEKEYNLKSAGFNNQASENTFLINQLTDYSNQLTTINTPVSKSLKYVNYSVGTLILLTLFLGIWKYTTTDSDGYYNQNSPASGSPAISSVIYTVSAPEANMRQGPSSQYSVITKIPRGSNIEVLNTDNSSWYKVRYNGNEGYINSKLLTYGSNSSSSIKRDTATPTVTSTEYVPENTGNTNNSNSNVQEVKQKQYEWVICSDCYGKGVIAANSTCNSCNGTGASNCIGCNGRGFNICEACDGRKYFTCTGCDGRGYNTCNGCDGKGYILDSYGRRSTCMNCLGKGKNTCMNCLGKKVNTCGSCLGKGSNTCGICLGRGKSTCSSCSGTGKFSTNGTCPKCNGKGQIQQEM